MRIRWSAVGFDTRPFETSATQKAVANYAEYRQRLAIREKVILYESDLGEAAGGQPLAIFGHLLDHPGFSGFLHVWSLAKNAPPPPAHAGRPDVILVAKGSDRYLRYLAEARYLVSNAPLPAYFSRRPEQSYLLAWDGSTAAAREKGPAADPGFMGHRNMARNILHATHVASPDAQASDLLMHGNDVASAFAGKLAETGDPREDLSARRATDFFFRGEESRLVTRYRSDRERLLFFGGHFAPNGITSSCIDLLRSLPTEKYDISVAIDTNIVAPKPDNRAKLAELPDALHVLGRVGLALFTHEQRWAYESFHAMGVIPSEEMRAVLTAAMRGEFERTFGSARWKAVVNFEGFTRFWAAMFAAAPAPADRIIYLHNDMVSESKTRVPALAGVFEFYRDYAKLVSPSPSVYALNRANLSQAYGLPPDRFRIVGNVILPASLRERAGEPLREDIAEWAEGRTLFATVGRLSLEKDHRKLIFAFADVHRAWPQARLVIVGDGPMREALQRQIGELGLQDAVLLAGMMHNPMPVFARMDCFVLSSNHEGQGIVLLEALVLAKPVISTDVVGCRSVLENGEGMLVENSAAGLAGGMLAFLEGRYEARPFAADAYAKTAIDAFNALIEG
nr:glycosyltransferase [Shinella pollutisoli]